LRVALPSYLRGNPKVYSLVASVPFSPVDVDVGRLARGEWNPLTDRFRVWFLPKEGEKGRQLCYVMVRKLDVREMVLVYLHVVANVDAEMSKDSRSFTLGILCNDDVRARAAMNSILDIPPSFHRRNELKLVERRWRSDPEVVARFAANVYSAVTLPTGRNSLRVSVKLPVGLMSDIRNNVGTWW
jgi:hypothetical protein